MLLDVIKSAWSWTGLVPDEILRTNAFGNVIVRARDGQVWRICPEELTCKIVAVSEVQFRELEEDREFQNDWLMARLVEVAENRLGPLSDERCYCLKVPAVLGGAYDPVNMGTNSVEELIAFAGDIAEQIKDLPDGAQVKLVVK